MFKSITARLLAGTLALVLVPLALALAALAWLAVQRSSEALTERAIEQLTSLRTVKASEMRNYAQDVRQFMRLLAVAPQIREAFRRMPAAIETDLTRPLGEMEIDALRDYYTVAFGEAYQRRNPGTAVVDMSGVFEQLDPVAVAMQHRYISGNPHPLGEKYKLADPADGSGYAALHAALHPYMARAYEEYGFYDFFLVDPGNGRVLYTYFKELDFGTTLETGPWADSGLGQAYALARDAVDGEMLQSTEFATYRPSYDDPAAFVSLPVTDANGERIGVLVAQLPIDRINRLMTFEGAWEAAGLGQTGEVFLVGSNRTPRSNARGMVESLDRFLSAIPGLDAARAATMRSRASWNGVLPLDLASVRAALGGATGTGQESSVTGLPVLASWAPLEFLGQSWGVVAQIGRDEALQSAQSLLRTILYAALATLGVLGLLGVWFATRLAGSINRPVRRLTGTVQQLNEGDFDARAQLTGSDELGQLGRAFDQLLDERVSTLRLQAEENEQLNNSVIEIMQAVGQLAQRDLTVKVPVTADVTGAVSDAINLMTSETSSALRQVFGISANVAQASSRVKQRSDAVLQMAEQSGNEVAAASTELAQAAQALNLIAADAQRANAVAGNAISATREALDTVRSTASGVAASRDAIRETEKRIKRLGERSNEINAVVGIISTIAERTSILALNAAMQAVAAGEAGRGFAVVAEEVKRLAENARDATQQIGNLVSGIQADTVEAVQSMNEAITQVVDISRLAESAGQRMHQTQQATAELVSAVSEIAGTTRDQARVSDTLIQRAEQIAVSTRSTLDQVNQQNQETARLLQFARNLLDTVRQFKLPAE